MAGRGIQEMRREMNRDKILHTVANKVLNLSSKEYRLKLWTVIEVGHEALKHEDIIEELLDRRDAAKVR